MGDVQETKIEVHSDKPFYDEDHNTSLHFASANGNLEEATNCVEKYKKIDLENILGWTPLMMAARNGHVDVVKLLIDAKANATKKNHYGCSVFMMACADGNMEMIEYVLQHLLSGGVSKQIIESTLSPISLAILFKNDHIVQHLLAKGFNVNAEAVFTGITPLMYAAAMKNTTVFNILISHGANLYAKNVNEQSAQGITESQSKSRRPNLHLHIPQQHQHAQQNQQQHSQHVPSPQIVSYIPGGNVYNMRSPIAFVSPQPMLMPMALAPPAYQQRSSNLSTPFFVSPALTPIDPVGQMFFPPDFNHNDFSSPMNGYCYAGDNQVFEQHVGYPHIFNPYCNAFNVTYTLQHHH